MSDNYVQISAEEYEELKRDSEFLSILCSYGLDNWGGYEPALEELFSS